MSQEYVLFFEEPEIKESFEFISDNGYDPRIFTSLDSVLMELFKHVIENQNRISEGGGHYQLLGQVYHWENQDFTTLVREYKRDGNHEELIIHEDGETQTITGWDITREPQYINAFKQFLGL